MTKANPRTAKPKAAEPDRSKMSAEELTQTLRAAERAETRHEPVTVKVVRKEDGGLDLSCPHDDPQGWVIRLNDAFSTRSPKFTMGQVSGLLAMVGPASTRPDSEVNTMLAAVDAMRPKTEIEGMLAVQMASTHHLAIEEPPALRGRLDDRDDGSARQPREQAAADLHGPDRGPGEAAAGRGTEGHRRARPRLRGRAGDRRQRRDRRSPGPRRGEGAA